jgi:hypothetical protein
MTFAAWLSGVQRYIKMIILKIPPGYIRENRKLIENDDFITLALIFASFKNEGFNDAGFGVRSPVMIQPGHTESFIMN